jgi:hypothetical protein
VKDALIASHLLGGASGLNLSLTMKPGEIVDTVAEAMRITSEIKKQVTDNPGRLMVAHLLGGTSGVKLSPAKTAQEIEAMVRLASRVLKEVEKQVSVKNHST